MKLLYWNVQKICNGFATYWREIGWLRISLSISNLGHFTRMLLQLRLTKLLRLGITEYCKSIPYWWRAQMYNQAVLLRQLHMLNSSLLRELQREAKYLTSKSLWHVQRVWKLLVTDRGDMIFQLKKIILTESSALYPRDTVNVPHL